jgi:hypothetical protein
VDPASECFDVEWLGILPVDSISNATKPDEIAKVLLEGGRARHLRDRAMSELLGQAHLADQ